MATKILVESFYDNTIQSNMTTSSTSVNVDVAPANDISYAVIANGEANQEIIKWQAKAGLTLSSLLRGLSLTALTDTEVAGNKKTHVINDSIQITNVHYLINDKVSNEAEETIAGLKTFTLAPKSSAAAAATKELMRWDEAVKNTGNESIDGVKTFTSLPLLPNSSPTTDNQPARKKYVDDQILALGNPTYIAAHAIYTPAYLTGGASAESNTAIWDSVSDGAFQITINGTARSITGLDFSAITDMDDVAAVIQAGIRALTGSAETCVWSTDHFIISSVLTTSSSAITVATAGASGTDISGAGAGAYMDSDTGNGTVTNKALDETADSGSLDKLDANGLHKAEFMPSNLRALAATGTTNATGTELETLTDGSDASALHNHGTPTSQSGMGNDSKGGASGSGNIDISVAPFSGSNVLLLKLSIYATVVNDDSADACEARFLDIEGIIGGEFGGWYCTATAASTSLPVPFTVLPALFAGDGSFTITCTSGTGNAVLTVSAPAMNSTNLRIAWDYVKTGGTGGGASGCALTVSAIITKLK